MTVKGMKKTLNLHKYSVRVNSIILNWKYILLIIFAIAGLIFGCINGKGEGSAYNKLIELFKTIVLDKTVDSNASEFIRFILYPSLFIGLLFFCGMCAFGSFISAAIPFLISAITGMISYYMYSTYMLKGLAYCIILIFPYAVLCVAGAVFCAAECINMSEVIMNNLTNSNRRSDYSFTVYCRKFLSAYLIIIAAAIIKVILDRLFIGLFLF